MWMFQVRTNNRHFSSFLFPDKTSYTRKGIYSTLNEHWWTDSNHLLSVQRTCIIFCSPHRQAYVSCMMESNSFFQHDPLLSLCHISHTMVDMWLCLHAHYPLDFLWKGTRKHWYTSCLWHTENGLAIIVVAADMLQMTQESLEDAPVILSPVWILLHHTWQQLWGSTLSLFLMPINWFVQFKISLVFCLVNV